MPRASRGLKFWRYAKLLEDTRIPADGWRDEAWPLPADAKGPFKADIRLNFRTYPKWVSDAVRRRAELAGATHSAAKSVANDPATPPVTPDAEPQS